MTHHALPSSWEAYGDLPEETKALADKNFELLKSNPRHPSLHFKKVGPFWSSRVGKSYRALARRQEDTVYWFWIGTHARYDRLIGG